MKVNVARRRGIAQMTTSGHERMSSVDTAWLRMDGPAGSMMIVGVSTTATPIRPADFRRMVEQRIDPRTAGIDWNELRHSQRDAAGDTVKATLVLDEVARRA